MYINVKYTNLIFDIIGYKNDLILNQLKNKQDKNLYL